ncbi:alpha/beta fold hydrolase [Asticcacaulis biprosthecium]|nr:alpha/beta hydrolase [Asticcacaulis biprosthecium]
MSLFKRHALTISGAGTRHLIFLHGVGCDQHVWHYISPRFERTHRVVLLDLIGSGNSDHAAFEPERYKTLQGQADDLIAICRSLGGGPVDVVGHSLGGMAALLAASQAPELFSRLLLLNVSPCHRNLGNYEGGFSDDDIEGLLASLRASLRDWSAHVAPLAIADDGQTVIIDELEGYFCSNNSTILEHQVHCALMADLRDDLSKVTVPCVLFHCRNDAFVSQDARNCLMEALPNVASADILTSGHFPNLTDPEVVTAAIRFQLSKVI